MVHIYLSVRQVIQSVIHFHANLIHLIIVNVYDLYACFCIVINKLVLLIKPIDRGKTKYSYIFHRKYAFQMENRS